MDRKTYVVKMCILPKSLSSVFFWNYTFSSAQFSPSVMSDSLRPHGLQHARPLCPSPTPGAYSDSCPLSQWRHPTISSSVIPFSSHLQSFPESRSFPLSQFFTSGGQVLEFQLQPQSLQWIPRTDLEDRLVGSPCCPRDSQESSLTPHQKHQFFSAQLSLWSNSHIHTWLLEKP